MPGRDDELTPGCCVRDCRRGAVSVGLLRRAGLTMALPLCVVHARVLLGALASPQGPPRTGTSGHRTAFRRVPVPPPLPAPGSRGVPAQAAG